LTGGGPAGRKWGKGKKKKQGKISKLGYGGEWEPPSADSVDLASGIIKIPEKGQCRNEALGRKRKTSMRQQKRRYKSKRLSVKTASFLSPRAAERFLGASG